MKTLILTPNRETVCGMYQNAVDLAKELNGDIYTKGEKMEEWEIGLYNQVITFLHPVHKSGRFLKENYGLKWICYDQKVPPPTKKSATQSPSFVYDLIILSRSAIGF